MGRPWIRLLPHRRFRRKGNPGRKYGSYRIEDQIMVMAQESRFELGHGTNHEAEFEALIRALQNLREISHRTGVDLAITSVRVITDSMIVRNRLMGKNTITKEEGRGQKEEGRLLLFPSAF